MPKLIVIQGNICYRYVNGKFDGQKAEIDFETSINSIKKSIEHFREHGLDFSGLIV